MSDRGGWDESVTVTLRRGQWMALVAAAKSYDTRLPAEQGDGWESLRTIEEALTDECQSCRGTRYVGDDETERCPTCGGDR